MCSRIAYDVRDTIQAKGNTGPIDHYTITGLVELPGVSLGSATIAMFDVATAQALLGKQGRYGSISVIGKPDVTPELLATQIRPLLSPTQTVRTSAAQASSDTKTARAPSSQPRCPGPYADSNRGAHVCFTIRREMTSLTQQDPTLDRDHLILYRAGKRVARPPAQPPSPRPVYSTIFSTSPTSGAVLKLAT